MIPTLPVSVARARSPWPVWVGFWALVVLVDVVYDLLQAGGVPPGGFVPQVVQWTVFWGTWGLASLPWIWLLGPVARLPRHRVGVVLAAILVTSQLHLGLAATGFRLVDGTGTIGGRWWTFAISLGARDVLLAGSLAAVGAGWWRHRVADEERLHALQRHLRPHFVSNVLNGVSGALRGGQPDVAVEIVARLGRLMRAEVDQPELVELRDELAMVRDYLQLEALRMGSRMEVSYAVDPDAMRARVPSFLVQPVAENAVRHGVERSVEPVRIELRVWRERGRLSVQVDDSGPGLAEGAPGRGLAVLRARLQLVYGRRASCSLGPRPGGGTRACITLPYVSATVP